MKKNGFSLIELIVVLLVLGILATIALPSVLTKRDRARETATKNNMHTLQLAAEDFATMCEGFYPVAPTIDVQTILNYMGGPGTSSNPRLIADASPGTKYSVSTTSNALLPGGQTFINPFHDEANSLDHLAHADPPVAPAHAVPASGTSGSGTSYWAPCGLLGGFGNCTDYAIYGDGKYIVLDYILRSVR